MMHPKRDFVFYLKARNILEHILFISHASRRNISYNISKKEHKQRRCFFIPMNHFVRAGLCSFFNLFHYDYGCLNTHKDRYLVTVIAAHSLQDEIPRSALWVRSSTGTWHNVDRLLPAERSLF